MIKTKTMIKKNVPYRKELVNGIVTNPITKDEPYLNNPSIAHIHAGRRSGFRMWNIVRNQYFKGKIIAP
jgi:hypothetical protein